MDVELHQKGVSIAARFLENEGFQILEINEDPKTTPQILAKRNGQLTMIMVAVETLPKIGELNPEMAQGFANYAMQRNALSYFLGIGLENLGEQTRVKIKDLQIVTVEIPLPSDDLYGEHYPTRVRLNRVPNFPKLPPVKVIWRTDGRAVVDGGDWRLNQWQGIFNGHVTPDNYVKIMFTDSRINPEIVEHWQRQGLPNPVFEVPVNEVWLADDEIFRIMPQMTADDVKNFNLSGKTSSENIERQEEAKSWWKVW